ncbi:MAG: RagB/SusD family nutrient uptake outer membrane protein, partial [Muribaculaceae bacterium]|nr:RagB/SusD family nutrient uptake outer membrane protein [Muribaculaceae bacterium]
MKKFNKYIALALGAVALTSCEDLDTEYLGYYVTTEQKQSTLEQNPEMAQAAVTGVFASFSSYGAVYNAHFDFGYPAIMMGLDLQGPDMITANIGYNHFNYWEGFTSPTASGTPSAMAWYHIYDQIYAANSVAATIPADTEEDLLKFYRAQAVGTRAFDYWVLAQLYQFNYAGNEDKPCVPVITNENSDEAAVNGCPRFSVADTYAQILKDINEAIDLLNATTYTPEQVIDSKPKRMISKAVAYGLQARIYLTMHKYAEAAAAAEKAIGSFSGRPLTIAEASVPGFSSIDDPEWMWGVAIAETDRVVTTGICNFPSMMGSFNGNGYASAGVWKWLNMKVYDAIPATDCRKNWFLDANLKSATLTAQQQSFLDSF